MTLTSHPQVPVAGGQAPDRRLQWLGVSAIVVALTLLTAPLIMPLVLRQVYPRLTGPVQPVATVESWPTAPATFVALAPPSIAHPTRTPLPQPTPEWRKLNHLTTVEFTTASIVLQQRTADYEEFLSALPLVGDTFLPALGKDIVTDRLVMKAVGKVQLGVDLAQVSDVEVTGKQIRLRLPPPAVVAVEILPEKTQIFDSQQVWFLSQYAGMETAALEQARTQLHSEVADNEELMKLTAEMARLQLTTFLRKAGFTTVEITFNGS